MHYPNTEQKKYQTLILGISLFVIITSVSSLFFHLPNIIALLKILNTLINQNPENPESKNL